MKIALIAAVLAVSGCATTRMAVTDLDTYQIDCANKDAQIRFLKSQQTSANDRLAAIFTTNREQARAMNDREYDAIVRKKIWDINAKCARKGA